MCASPAMSYWSIWCNYTIINRVCFISTVPAVYSRDSLDKSDSLHLSFYALYCEKEDLLITPH